MMVASMMEKATFNQLCKLMGAGDETVKKFVQGALKVGLLWAVGLLGAGTVTLFGEGAKLVEDSLNFAADDGNAAAYTAQKIVEFFQKKESYNNLEKAQITHALMVFSAYFDALQANAPDECKSVGLVGAEKEYLVKYAQTQPWDEDLAGHDLFLPTTDGDLPKSYEGLGRFYLAMTNKLRDFMAGHLETLPGQKKEQLNAVLNTLPDLAVATYKDQLLSLSEKSNTFLIYNLFNSLENIKYTVTGIDKKVDTLLQRNTPTASYGLPVLPNPSDNFLEGSRNRELEDLEALLNQRRTLFIFGVGGIGKTETAIQLGRRCGSAHLIRFTPPIIAGQSAIEKAILDLVIDNYRYTPSRENMDDALRRNEEFCQRLEILRNHFSGHMLIVDNFDCPGRTLDQLRGERNFRELEGCGLKLVFTTRYLKGNHPGVEIQPLDDDQLLTIMRKDCPQSRATDGQLRDLMEAVDSHTLTCVLIAKTLGDSWTDVIPAQMLEALRNAHLDQNAYPDVISDQNSGWDSRKIYGHLKALFDLSGMSQTRQAVLRYATLLPTGGMELKLVRACLSGGETESLRALVDTGWITFENVRLSLHAVIREVCREELKPDDDNCGDFLNKLRDLYDPNDYKAARYRQLAQVFTAAAQTLPDQEGNWAIRAGVLWNQLGQPGEALPLELQAVSKLETTQPNSTKLATACNNVGDTYGELGDHNKALEFQLKAMEIRKNVLPENHPDLALSYNNMGSTYGELGDRDKALAFQLKSLEIRKNVLPENHPDLALSYNNVGLTYGDLGEHNKALEFQLKALKIRKTVLPENHPLLAQSYNNVGYTCGELGEHNKALEFQLKALKIRETVLPQNHPDLASSYNNVGCAYGALGDYDKALAYQLRTLEIQETVLPDNHPLLATSYNNVGCTYGELGDRDKELELKLKALKIRETVLPDNHPDRASSYNNVGYTYSELGDQNKALDYHLKALKIRETVLPENHPLLAQSYNNVGYTYAAVDNLERAIFHTQRALAIAEYSLPERHPDRELYQRNYDILSQLIEKQSGHGKYL